MKNQSLLSKGFYPNDEEMSSLRISFENSVRYEEALDNMSLALEETTRVGVDETGDWNFDALPGKVYIMKGDVERFKIVMVENGQKKTLFEGYCLHSLVTGELFTYLNEHASYDYESEEYEEEEEEE